MYFYQSEELLNTSTKFGIRTKIDKAAEANTDDSYCIAVGKKKYLDYYEALAQIIYLAQMKNQMITYINRRTSRINAIRAS